MRVRAFALLLAVLAGLLSAPSPSTAQSVKERLQQAEEDLETSSAAVQAAGAALTKISSELPAAQRDVARARGELEAARARSAAATSVARRAELALAAAQRKVDGANDEIDQGRDTMRMLARRSYQQGELGELSLLLRSGSPQEVVDRAETLKVVFRGLDDGLARMTRARVQLAQATAELDQERRVLDGARREALAQEGVARTSAARADAAVRRVSALVAQRASALRVAESERAGDLVRYRKAQAESRALAERIRAAARARAAAGRQFARPSSARMVWPANGPMTSRYGTRTHPIYGDTRFHAGIDIGAGSGSPIFAADDGTVVFAGQQGGYGNIVIISHGSEGGRDLTTSYAHQSSIGVSPGQSVSRGQQVGRVGSTGNSTGPHLHFEVRLDGDPTDPLNYVREP